MMRPPIHPGNTSKKQQQQTSTKTSSSSPGGNTNTKQQQKTHQSSPTPTTAHSINKNDYNPQVALEDYVRDLRATISEQKRHLDIARLGLEKELAERLQYEERISDLEGDNEKLHSELEASKIRETQLRDAIEHQRAETQLCRHELSKQNERCQYLADAAETEKETAEQVRIAYEKLKEEFDNNERVFKELLGALREKQQSSSSSSRTNIALAQLDANQSQQQNQSQNNSECDKSVKNNTSNTSTSSQQQQEKIGGDTSAAVWLSAWRQLKQRRHLTSAS